MRKIVMTILVLIMMATVFVGCSKEDENSDGINKETTGETTKGESEKDGKEDEEKKVLTVMMSSGDAGPGSIKKALDKAAEILNVTLKVDVIPDDQMLNVANTRLLTGNAGDLIVHNFGLTDIASGNLEPLEGEWTDKITTTTKPLTLDENGNVLKAPLGGETNMGLLYNKKVLEASGVELPIKNYDDFIRACEQIKAAGYTPVYLSNKEVWTAQILLLTTMTSIFEDNSALVEQIITNQIKPSEVPEIVELWENAKSIQELGYVNADYMSATNDMAFEALANGEVAFYAMLDNAYGTLKEFYPEQVDDIGMMYTPLWNDEEDAYVLFGTATNYLSVVSGSEQTALAKEFIDVMLSEEPLSTYYELVPGAVPYNDLGYDLNMSPFNAEMKAYAQEMRSLGDFNNHTYNGETPLEPFYGKFSEQVQALFAGLEVEEALDNWYDAYVADAQARRIEGF